MTEIKIEIINDYGKYGTSKTSRRTVKVEANYRDTSDHFDLANAEVDKFCEQIKSVNAKLLHEEAVDTVEYKGADRAHKDNKCECGKDRRCAYILWVNKEIDDGELLNRLDI